MFDFIAGPLGKVLYFIYDVLAFRNYGIAIIFFTLVIKIVLMPLTIKQTKSMAKMTEVQPLLQDIQKRYAGDKEKINQETMKLYQEKGVNPMGGCLPLLIQMPILISLFSVITRPLTFMLGKSKEVIEILKTFVNGQLGVVARYPEIEILNYFHTHAADLNLESIKGILSKSELINFNFLGLNLGFTPTINTAKLFGAEIWTYLPLLLIPLLATAATFLATKLTTPQPAPGAGKQAGSMKYMQYMGPAITLMFSFQLPAGIGLYWLAQNAFQIVERLVINKFILNKPKAISKEEALKIEESKNGSSPATSPAPKKANTAQKGNASKKADTPQKSQNPKKEDVSK